MHKLVLRRDNLKMILLWVTLLFLQHVFTHVPTTTVHLGEPTTFTCALPGPEISHRELSWYKQSIGETLRLIVSVRKSIDPNFSEEFDDSRIKIKYDKNVTNLTILRTRRDDEGMYHCAVSEWMRKTEWSATYLLVKGINQRTTNLTLVQQPSASSSVHPRDLVTLQCSVLSASETKTCSGSHSVFWLRAGSDQTHPNIIYTDANRRDECEERSDSVKSCAYHFSKNVSSSDAGTYYCAVDTCGHILFGNGITVGIEGKCSQMAYAGILLLSALLALSLFVIAILLCAVKDRSNDLCNAFAVHKNSHNPRSQLERNFMRDGVYSAAVFTMMTSGAVKDVRPAEKERIYAAMKAFGLD